MFTCSGVFQGLGNTIPAMLSSAIRLAVFVPLAVWLAAQPAFHLDEVWWLSVATVWLQAVVSYRLAAPAVQAAARRGAAARAGGRPWPAPAET